MIPNVTKIMMEQIDNIKEYTKKNIKTKENIIITPFKIKRNIIIFSLINSLKLISKFSLPIIFYYPSILFNKLVINSI